jgi:predicted dehydrogenase
MLGVLAPVAEACDLSVPVAHRRRLGLVGAGAIVDAAHLPAYAAAGLEVAGIFDLDQARAQEVAARHGVGRVFAGLDELLACPEVEVVDIAVAPEAQPEIARRALEAGKHVLCQKPFAPSVAEGQVLVDLAEARGLQIAVNQQLRFDEGIAATKAVLDLGWIGAPTALTFTVDVATDWTAWPWLVASERLEIMYHSIHYLDSVRYLLGDPLTVYCTGSRRAGQAAVGETRTMTTLVYPGDLRVLLHVNHENHCGDAVAGFRLDGTHGSVRATLGLMYDYPRGRPDTVEVFSRVLPTDGWLPYPVTQRWIPDAFAGPVGSLLASLETGRPPVTSGRDNLGTLRLVHAAYESMDTGQVVALA